MKEIFIFIVHYSVFALLFWHIYYELLVKTAGSLTTMEEVSGACAKNTSTNRDVGNFLHGATGVFQYWQITFKLFLLLHLRNKPLGPSPPPCFFCLS